MWGVDLFFCWRLFIFSLFIVFSGSAAWVAGFLDDFFLLSVDDAYYRAFDETKKK